MDGYTICNDYLEIICGTKNTITKEYREAAKNVEENSMKGLGYLKNFITSIENLAGKENVKDTRISSTKGNIQDFQGYENIKTAMNFINKNLSGIDIMGNIKTIYDALESNKSLYMEGYNKNVRLVILEYESSLYMLVTGLSMVMANNMDVVQNGTQIKIQKKHGSTYGIIPKTIVDLSKQLSNNKHKEYLEEMLKSRENSSKIDTEMKESTYFESTVSDTLDLVDSIFKNVGRIGHYTKRLVTSVKNSLFGIVPLIRSILYLRYKKKADTILALDQRVNDIEKNIEQLRNIKTIDPAKKEEIIKKQKAVCEAYRKKSEKLRAELTEGEKDAAVAIKKEDPQIKNTDDDFILEGVRVQDFFESTTRALNLKRYSKILNRKGNVKGKGPGGRYGSVTRNSVWKTVEIPKDVDIEKAIKNTTDEFCKITGKDSIRLELGANVPNDSINERTISKIGGTPYWPKNQKYPTGIKGEPMIMIAQINFSELPHLDGYPTKGLLQFFVNDAEYTDTGDDKIKVIYHERYATEEYDMLDKIPRTTFFEDKNYDFPFTGMFKIIKGVLEKQYLHYGCEEFNDIINPIIEKHFNVKIKCIWDFPKDIYDKILKKIEENSWGTRIGGQPNFTQWDPRQDGKYQTLLFQLDSEKGIMWGDVGIANWFIDEKNLRAKNFNKVFFTWDCY